jgi:hypothetical protein
MLFEPPIKKEARRVIGRALAATGNGTDCGQAGTTVTDRKVLGFPLNARLLTCVLMQENSSEPMEGALRTEESEKAYTDFIESLAEIQQPSPLQSEHTGANARNQRNPPPAKLAELAKRERTESLRKNERSANRSASLLRPRQRARTNASIRQAHHTNARHQTAARHRPLLPLSRSVGTPTTENDPASPRLS